MIDQYAGYPSCQVREQSLTEIRDRLCQNDMTRLIGQRVCDRLLSGGIIIRLMITAISTSIAIVTVCLIYFALLAHISFLHPKQNHLIRQYFQHFLDRWDVTPVGSDNVGFTLLSFSAFLQSLAAFISVCLILGSGEGYFTLVEGLGPIVFLSTVIWSWIAPFLVFCVVRSVEDSEEMLDSEDLEVNALIQELEESS